MQAKEFLGDKVIFVVSPSPKEGSERAANHQRDVKASTNQQAGSSSVVC
jgi:hypothetical protein